MPAPGPLRSIMEIGVDEWRAYFRLPAIDTYDVLIVEGSWLCAPRKECCLGLIIQVRELHLLVSLWWRGARIRSRIAALMARRGQTKSSTYSPS